jgi:hypothetical protein
MIKYLSIQMAKNILRKQFAPMYGKNKPYQTAEPLPDHTIEPEKTLSLPEKPSITVTTVILFTILVFFAVVLYLNRNRIYVILQKIYNDFKPSDKIDQIEQKYHDLSYNSSNDSKILQEILRTEKTILDTIEQKEKNLEQTEKKQETGGVKQIEEKINRYSNEQTVKGNGFCYIGYDKNQRECTNVYEGDICMSGQIFPTMAVCLDPHLRP